MTSLINHLLPPCLRAVDKPNKIRQEAPDEFVKKIGLLCLNLMRQTFESLLRHKYHHFDALVGETSCQLRASHVAELALEFLDKRVELVQRIQEIDRVSLNLLRTEQKDLSGKQVDDILKRLTGKITLLPLEERFLMLAHLLTTTREAVNKQETNEQNLEKYGLKLCPEVLREMAFHAKRELAALSVNYMKTSARAMGDPVLEIMASSKQIQESQGRQCTPCYYSSTLLLKVIRKKELPVFLIIKDDQGNLISRVAVCSLNGKLPQQAAVVIEGVSRAGILAHDLVEQLLDLEGGRGMEKLEELVLACASMHPQYAGDAKMKEIPLHSKDVGLGKLVEKCRVATEDTIGALLQAMQPGELERARIACNPSGKVDRIDLLSKVILSKLRMDQMKAIAAQKNIGIDDSPDVLFTLKHIYCLSVEEVLKIGGGNDE